MIPFFLSAFGLRLTILAFFLFFQLYISFSFFSSSLFSGTLDRFSAASSYFFFFSLAFSLFSSLHCHGVFFFIPFSFLLFSLHFPFLVLFLFYSFFLLLFLFLLLPLYSLFFFLFLASFTLSVWKNVCGGLHSFVLVFLFYFTFFSSLSIFFPPLLSLTLLSGSFWFFLLSCLSFMNCSMRHPVNRASGVRFHPDIVTGSSMFRLHQLLSPFSQSQQYSIHRHSFYHSQPEIGVLTMYRETR